jgi:group I intron endonuclease
MESGIYCIERIETGQQYIGKAKNLNQRMWSKHRGCKYVLHALEKYRKDEFIRYIVEYCEPTDLVYWEQYYIKKWNTKVPNGYNLTDGGEGTLGYNHTDEAKELMRKAKTGKYDGKNNPNYENHALAGENNPNYGKPMKDSTKKLLSDANKGRLHTDEEKRLMSKNHWNNSGENHPLWGTHPSLEVLKLFSKQRSGKNNPRFGTKLFGTTSLFFGIFKITRKKRGYISWRAMVGTKNLGEYKTEMEAVLVRDKYIRENNSSYPLNFTEEDKQ